MPELTLSIPARPDFVHVLRTVIASVAAQLDFSYEDIEDLRIAVDETCTHLLRASPSSTTIHLRIRPSQAAIEVLASIDGAPQVWPSPGARDALTWKVLSALADQADFDQADLGAAIRFTKQAARG